MSFNKELKDQRRLEKDKKNLVRQKKSWVDSGSGSFPSE